MFIILLAKYLNYHLLDQSIAEAQVIHDPTHKTWRFNYACQTNHDCSPYNVSFHPGFYRFRVCGAQGGNTIGGYNAVGGFGGCVSGNIEFLNQTWLLLRVGGAGENSDCVTIRPYHGGWNGGGGHYGGAATGGGASDVSTDNTCGGRIIVGGGGGGANDARDGGHGGGLIGLNGHTSASGFPTSKGYAGGGGGSQTAGGTGLDTSGTFCQGGSYPQDLQYVGGGGGGGYYGGGLGSGSDAGGGGGSGFLSGYNQVIVDGYAFETAEFETGVNSGNGFIEVSRIRRPFTLRKRWHSEIVAFTAHLLLPTV